MHARVRDNLRVVIWKDICVCVCVCVYVYVCMHPRVSVYMYVYCCERLYKGCNLHLISLYVYHYCVFGTFVSYVFHISPMHATCPIPFTSNPSP
jgi:hypothetical protein